MKGEIILCRVGWVVIISLLIRSSNISIESEPLLQLGQTQPLVTPVL